VAHSRISGDVLVTVAGHGMLTPHVESGCATPSSPRQSKPEYA
jgi:hypothetical protein